MFGCRRSQDLEQRFFNSGSSFHFNMRAYSNPPWLLPTARGPATFPPLGGSQAKTLPIETRGSGQGAWKICLQAECWPPNGEAPICRMLPSILRVRLKLRVELRKHLDAVLCFDYAKWERGFNTLRECPNANPSAHPSNSGSSCPGYPPRKRP